MVQGLELYYKPWTIFYLTQSLGILCFVLGMIYKFSFYFKGKRKSIYRKPNYFLMFRGLIRDVLFQRQIAERSLIRWFIHILIFYGFMGLMLLSAIAVTLETFIPATSPLSQYMLTGQGFSYYKLAGDLFGLLLLIGVFSAILRRIIFRNGQLATDINDTTTLFLLLLLVSTGFVLEGMRISLMSVDQAKGYSFIGNLLAGLFRNRTGIGSMASQVWVTHGALTALLFAYFPHSKFLHIINSPVEIMVNASEENMRSDLYL